MTNYKPLIYSLMIIFAIGLFLNLIVGLLIDTDVINPDSILFGGDFFQDNLLDILVEPTFLDNIGFVPILNPFALLPDVATEFIYTQIVLLSYVPDSLLIPMIIIILFSIVWSIVKLVLP